MIGQYFLWLAIGEGSLFLFVLAFAAIGDLVRERRLRCEAEALERAPRHMPGRAGGDDAESVAALLSPVARIAA